MVWCEIIQENFPSIFVTHKVKVSLIQLIKLNILFLLCIYVEIFYFFFFATETFLKVAQESVSPDFIIWKEITRKGQGMIRLWFIFTKITQKKSFLRKKMNLVKVNYWGFLYIIIKPDVIRKYDNNLNKIKPDLCRGKKHQR